MIIMVMMIVMQYNSVLFILQEPNVKKMPLSCC